MGHIGVLIIIAVIIGSLFGFAMTALFMAYLLDKADFMGDTKGRFNDFSKESVHIMRRQDCVPPRSKQTQTANSN